MVSEAQLSHQHSTQIPLNHKTDHTKVKWIWIKCNWKQNNLPKLKVRGPKISIYKLPYLKYVSLCIVYVQLCNHNGGMKISSLVSIPHAQLWCGNSKMIFLHIFFRTYHTETFFRKSFPHAPLPYAFSKYCYSFW